jgi:2-polyprenyl-3-methyl-5-hydroxy-6-metoxy-1,4-benzoquinol methylase
MSTDSYFAAQARNYDTRLKKGILGRVRNSEMKAIMKALDSQKGESILDIPCGSGFYADYMRAAGATVYGVDISHEMIEVFTQKGYLGEVGNLESLNLKRKFDKVLSAGGFEFCKHHRQIVDNLIAHVKDDGIIVIFFSGNNFFGVLYKLYHLISHNINAVIFSKKRIISLCTRQNIIIQDIKSCGLYGYVVKLKKVR